MKNTALFLNNISEKPAMLTIKTLMAIIKIAHFTILKSLAAIILPVKYVSPSIGTNAL